MLGDEKVKGLSLVDLYTDRGTPRLIGNIAIKSSICTHPIVGYENHREERILVAVLRPWVLWNTGTETMAKADMRAAYISMFLVRIFTGHFFQKTLVLPIFFCVLPARDVAFVKHSSRSMTQ